MNDFPLFPNAPITEAVLDIKVKLEEGADLTIFNEFQENVKDRFEDRKTKRSFMAEFKFLPEGDEPPKTGVFDKME